MNGVFVKQLGLCFKVSIKDKIFSTNLSKPHFKIQADSPCVAHVM